MIERVLEKLVKSKLYTGKAIVLLSTRQVGKTTLLKMLFGTSQDVLWLNGHELDVQAIFAAISATRLKATLYINKQLSPSFIVTTMLGASKKGSIALWVEIGTIGYFKNLKVSKE